MAGLTKVRLNLRDAFSGATDSRELELTDDQLAKAEHVQIMGTVQSEFKNNIRWSWIIEEVEILK